MDPAHQAQGPAQPDQAQAQAQAQPAYAYQPYHSYGQPSWGQPSAGYDMAYHQAAYGYTGYYADTTQEEQQQQQQQQQQPPWQLDLQQNGQSQHPEQQAQPGVQPSHSQEEPAPGTHQLPPQPPEGPPPAPYDAESQPALPPDSPPPLPPLPDHDPEPAAQTAMPAVDRSPQLPRPELPYQQEYDPTDALSPQPSPQLAHQQQPQQDSSHSADLTVEPPAQAPAYAYPHQQAYAASHAQAYAGPQAQAYASPQLPGYGAVQTHGYAPADHLHAGAWHAQGAMGMSAPYWPHMHQASYQAPLHSEQAPQSPPAARDTAASGAALFLPPGRHSRPRKLAIILRGLPGSGKSHAARLIKDLETQHGPGAPRIHSLDDYFVTDVEKEDRAEGSKSKRRKIRTQQYVYEPELEGAYLRSLLKAYSSTVQAARFELVIVDAPNLRVDDFKDFWAAGEGAGYQVYVAQPLESDPAVCAKRSTHGRTLDDVLALAPLWEDTPATFPQLNLRPLLSPSQREHAAIEEVTMEEDSEAGLLSGSAEVPDEDGAAPTKSRWSSMEEAEPEAEAPVAPQPKRPKRAQVLKSVLVASGKARRKRLLTWKDESPAEDGQPAQLCEVRVLSGLGPPKQATGHSFAEQARVHRNSEQHLFRELLLGGGPPS